MKKCIRNENETGFNKSKSICVTCRDYEVCLFNQPIDKKETIKTIKRHLKGIEKSLERLEKE